MAYLARTTQFPAPSQVTVQNLLAWAGSKQWTPETRHAYYTSFSLFFTWLASTQERPEPFVLPRVRRPRQPARPISKTALETLLTHTDVRVRRATLLGAGAGLRRSEIVKVKSTDLVDDLLGMSLLVDGKGGKARIVPLSDRLTCELKAAFRECPDSPFLFPGNENGHVSATWLGKLMNQEIPKPWTLHSLRHRFATDVYRTTRDITVVQQLLGHESIDTTQRYLAVDAEALRAAVNAIAA